MLNWLGRITTSYPRRVLAIWIVILAGCFPLANRLGDVLTTQTGLAPGGMAERVSGILEREFTTHDHPQVVLVGRARDAGAVAGERIPELQAAFRATVERLAATPYVEDVRNPQNDALLPRFGEQGPASVVILRLDSDDPDRVEEGVAHLQELLPRDGPLAYYLTGGPALDLELQQISKRDALRAELLGIPLSLVVLVFAIGSLVASAIPILAAMASITASFALLYLIGHVYPIAAFGQIIVTMLGLATGIDYSLLLVNRFREELQRTGDRHRAAMITTATAGKAVMFSGLTVLVALSALLVPPLEFVRSMGLASIAVMLFSVSVAVTAVPALLTLLGPAVNALQISRREPGTRSRTFWSNWARTLLRRPLLWTVGGIAILLLLASPALRMQFGFAGVDGLTAQTDVRQAQDVLAELELDGLLRSYDMVVDFGDRGFFHPSSVQAMSRLTREIAVMDGVESVYSPMTTGSLPRLFVFQYYASRETAEQGPLAELVDVTVSTDGRYALVHVFPGSGLAPAERNAMRDRLQAVVQEAGVEAAIGGDYVADEEWTDTLYGRFPIAVALVYLATFVLLGVAFRSIVIPIKSIILNTFTVGAAFGVITAIFQEGLLGSLFGVPGGLGFVETSVPIFIFAIVFGLSMDYEVFLMARIYEGHRQGLSDREAVVHALSATGGVITSAAMIMIVVFAVFLFSSVVLIRTLSVGLAVAILLDATLVRSALVPAVMILAGKWNWKIPPLMERVVSRLNVSPD